MKIEILSVPFLERGAQASCTNTEAAPMDDLTRKTVAVFSRPFTVPGFGETLPAGEYAVETELVSPPDRLHPEGWKASAMVKLHPRASHPGLARTLTVSLADLDHARARDKLTGRALSDFFLEEMLSDPMVRLVMKADGFSEAHLRHLYSGRGASAFDSDVQDSNPVSQVMREYSSLHVPESGVLPTSSERLSLS